MAAEIAMIDGTKFLTMPLTTADSLIQNLERRSFTEIELEDGAVHINPAHVVYIREV